MASRETVLRSMGILDDLTRKLGLYPLGPACFQKTKIMPVIKNGKRERAGLLERAYKALPENDIIRFLYPTNEPMAEPTDKEFAAFKTRLTREVRRAFNQDVAKILDSIGNPPGRPELKLERIKRVCETVEEYERNRKKYPTRSKAVEAAARFHTCTPMTVWNYLRLRKQSNSSDD